MKVLVGIEGYGSGALGSYLDGKSQSTCRDRLLRRPGERRGVANRGGRRGRDIVGIVRNPRDYRE